MPLALASDCSGPREAVRRSERRRRPGATATLRPAGRPHTVGPVTHPVRIGISGWRYPPWRGVFYPRGLPQRRELEHASGCFDSILPRVVWLS